MIYGYNGYKNIIRSPHGAPISQREPALPAVKRWSESAEDAPARALLLLHGHAVLGDQGLPQLLPHDPKGERHTWHATLYGKPL